MSKNVNYKLDKEKQKDWFPYSISKKKDDFIFVNGVHERCSPKPCDINCHEYNENYWKNFTIDDMIKKTIEIGCFGCSFTYGSLLPHDESWPDILENTIKISTGNFGVTNGGLDSCYINLINCYKKFRIKKAIVLIPFLDRRLLKFKKNDFYFQWPVNVNSEWSFDNIISSNHFDGKFINNELSIFKNQLILDKKNSYSLIVLDKIVKYCKINNIDLYLSAYELEIYKTIKEKYSNILPFYDLNVTTKRASDNIHPCKIHNEDWVQKIKNFL